MPARPPESETNAGLRLMRVVTRLNIGGPAIHTVMLTREMEARGYRTTLVAGRCEAEDGDMSYLLRAGDAVRSVPEMSRSVRPWNNLRALWRLWRLMRAERPQIVHTHTAMAGCLGRMAAIAAGVPVIVHTFHGNSLRHYFSPLASALFLGIERLLARRTDALCVVSPQQADELSRELRVAPREKFRVVPLGLDLSRCLEMPLPEPEGVFRVGWFGRLAPVKDIPLLIEVVRATLARSRCVEFHVAGDGPERPSVEEAVKRCGGGLVWHGWQRDIVPLLARCHLLVQTSRNEGTPVALIQGMAAARPFLSTPAGGVVDIVAGPRGGGDGARWYSNGVLCQSDPAVFARVILELAGAPGQVREMGMQARALAAARYPQERLCATLDALYRQLAGGKAERRLARRALPLFHRRPL